MEMCYDGALVMPNNYAVVDEEEMTYVEGGGWSSYTGLEAIGIISAMCGAAVGTGALAGKAAAFTGALAASSNPVGWIGALIGAFATCGLVGLTILNGSYAAVAAAFFFESWIKTKSFSQAGFQVYSISVACWTANLNIKSL